MRPKVLIDLLRRNVKDNIAIIGHKNADPDAVCSMYGLYVLLRHVLPENTRFFLAAEDYSKLSKRIMTEFEIDDLYLFDLEETPECAVIVDANNLEQIGILKEKVPPAKTKIFVIDHHEPHADTCTFSVASLIMNDLVSTAEIIVQIYEDLNVPMDSKTATLLLMGVIFDSRRFILIDDKIFFAVKKLLDFGADYQRALDMLRLPMDRSERIARLKAASRLSLFQIGNWIIAASYVSAFEASACRALIELGADVAVVIAERGDELRISARATEFFYQETGVSLAEVMERVGRNIGGSGGGHVTAAGANGKGDAKKGLNEFLKCISEMLGAKVETLD